MREVPYDEDKINTKQSQENANTDNTDLGIFSETDRWRGGNGGSRPSICSPNQHSNIPLSLPLEIPKTITPLPPLTVFVGAL